VSVLIGPVAATRNDLTLAEAVGLANGVAPVFLANGLVVLKTKAPPITVLLCNCFTVFQIGERHCCRLIQYGF